MMKHITILCICFCSLCCNELYSQNIIVSEDPQISALMAKFSQINSQQKIVYGWRVQILTTTDRRKWDSAKISFQNTYPEYKLIGNHQNPYYFLKTGAFMTQEDAYPFLNKLKKDFSGAILVRDEVEFSEILSFK